MKLTAFLIIAFFVCLNVCLYIISETAVLPYSETSPYETPSGISSKLLHVDLSTGNLAIAGTQLVIFIILSYITGHLIFGGTVAIILFAMELFFPIVKWVVFGLPTFLQQMGVSIVIYESITALLALVWFWFILGFVAQRQLEDV
jgi:hypothetical protein